MRTPPKESRMVIHPASPGNKNWAAAALANTYATAMATAKSPLLLVVSSQPNTRKSLKCQALRLAYSNDAQRTTVSTFPFAFLLILRVTNFDASEISAGAIRC